MSTKIQNDETKVEKNENINDIDILNDTLLSFKFLVDNYAVALNEASNKSIYDLYKNIFNNLSAAQQQIYLLAFQKGWYKVEEAEKNKIHEAFKTYSKKSTELNVN